MIKVAFVRGKFLNNFEGQNYRFDKKKILLTGISSRRPLHSKFPFNQIKLKSVSDFEMFATMVKAITNRTLGDSQILFGLKNLSHDFDIFHTADPHYYYSFQLAKLRKRNLIKRLISTSWETIPFNNESITRKKYIKNFTKKYVDLFICYTRKAKEALLKEGVQAPKIEVVTLGVDIRKFRPSLTKKNSRKNLLTILYVGRLVEEKGIMDLYEAYKKSQNRSAKLRIVGKGPLRARLERSIQRDGLESRVSLEEKSYERIATIYQNANIFILPSRTTKTWEEQYGMVLIEALASGLPIIAYDSGCIAENLGDGGILLREGDVQGLTQKINQLLQNYSHREKIGRMGRKRAEKFFDSEKTARKIERIYAQNKNV